MDESMTLGKFLRYYLPLIIIIIGWGINVQVKLATHAEKMAAYEASVIKTESVLESLDDTQRELTVAITTLNTYIKAKGL